MQTPGKATRRRSPRCTVNPLRNTLLPLQCPPPHRAPPAPPLPARFCPGQLAGLSATTQCLPPTPNLPFPCFVAPQIKEAIAASNKGSTLQQRGLAEPLSRASLASALPSQPSWLRDGSLGLGLSLRGKPHIQQWDGGGYRRWPGAAPCGGLGAAGVPRARLGEDAASELLQLRFLLHLTQTSRVFLLLFIHGEIVHP